VAFAATPLALAAVASLAAFHNGAAGDARRSGDCAALRVTVQRYSALP